MNVEVYDPQGARVVQKVYDQQTFSAGQARTYEFTWTAPPTAVTGAYTVKVGAFKAGWGTLYHWNNSAAQFTVTR